LAELGELNIRWPNDQGETMGATWGVFDVFGMLQQNKGCSSLCGPVAQLGARFHGMEEVIGSIPIRSTNLNPSLRAICQHRRVALLRVRGCGRVLKIFHIQRQHQ
jgi:hypothetical protein